MRPHDNRAIIMRVTVFYVATLNKANTQKKRISTGLLRTQDNKDYRTMTHALASETSHGGECLNGCPKQEYSWVPLGAIA